MPNQIQTLRVLVQGDPSLNRNASAATRILNELDAILDTASSGKPERRLLMQVLHTTRALDTSLKEFLNTHGLLTYRERGLGSYLDKAQSHRNPNLRPLDPLRSLYFKEEIVKRRNRYMHEADTYPKDDAETLALLADMHACLFEVLELQNLGP